VSPVDTVINGQDLADWHQEITELVAERSTVVARFRCSGIHRGPWKGMAPTERPMRIDEVYFFDLANGRGDRVWGLEDTRTRVRQLQGDDTELGDLGSLS
jgi:predicted ester cyclase